MADARVRAKKVMRAATIAVINGWTLGMFAAITSVTVLWGDWVSGILAVGLGACAFVELRGAGRLRKFDVSAARMLGFNQVALGAGVVIYAAWSYVAAKSGVVGAAGQTGDAGMDAMVADLANTLIVGLYGGMALFGVLVPGLNAWYYFTRARVMRELLAGTPRWVIEALKAAG